MTALPKQNYILPEEYLALEREALDKHEYFNGEIFLMPGASERHNTIAVNISISLHSQLKKRPCKVYQSAMRVYIENTGFYTYPDVSVVYDKPALVPDGHRDTLINPFLIVEVFSSSTEDYDKGAKFDNYRSLESLREYVLVSQDAKKVMRYTKQENGDWLLRDFIGDKTEIELSSIECVLTMEDIYDKVDFEE